MIDAGSIPMEVAVHVVSKQNGAPQLRPMRNDDSCISIGERMDDKPNGLSRDDDMEQRV